MHPLPPPFDLERLRAALDAAPVPGVVAAWLFGSAAAGRMHAESDVDVGVLLDRAVHPTEDDRFDARVALATELADALGDRAVDVVVLDDAPPLLAARIVTEGRLLVCRDAAREHAFRRDVQLLAGDLEPFVKRVRRRLAETLAR